MNRRFFKKKAYYWVAVVAILCGLTGVAYARGILPAIMVRSAVTHFGGNSWADWDEITEAGWGDTATAIVLFQNITTGGDEIGIGGGLSASDLVFTQSGNVVGATSSPPYRVLDGVANNFVYTTNFMTSMFNGLSSWTLIIKVADWASNTTSIFQSRRSTGPSYGFDIYGAVGGNLAVDCSPDGAGAPYTLNTTTAAAMPTSGTMYIAVWFDGSLWRAGFSTTKPTKWSDFAANNRITATDATQWNCAFNSGNYLGRGDAGYSAGKVFYLLASRRCLIDNAS